MSFIAMMNSLNLPPPSSPFPLAFFFALLTYCSMNSWIRWVCSASSQDHGNGAIRPTAIAVVGLSDKEGRPSYRVARKMQRLGYKIIPINPSHESILGEKCYASLQDLDQPIDVIQVFRAKEKSVEIAKEGSLSFVCFNNTVQSSK